MSSSEYIGYPGKVLSLQAFMLTQDSSTRSSQPSGFPKISIDYVNGSTVSNIISEQVMDEDISGEYFYEWTIPSNLGQYKIRYEGVVDSSPAFGYDIVDVFDLKLFLEQFDLKKTFSYNADNTVDTVVLDYGDPVVQQLEVSFTYNPDKTVDEMEINAI